MSGIKISRSKKWLKIKSKSGWKKINAPAYDKIIKPHMAVVKCLLELYGFKVEEKEDKIIPREAELSHGVNDPRYKLPTVSLHAHSSPDYPGLECEFIYWGDNKNKYFVVGPSALSESELSSFIKNMKELQMRGFPVYIQTKDLSSVRKIFEEYRVKTEEDKHSNS